MADLVIWGTMTLMFPYNRYIETGFMELSLEVEVRRLMYNYTEIMALILKFQMDMSMYKWLFTKKGLCVCIGTAEAAAAGIIVDGCA